MRDIDSLVIFKEQLTYPYKTIGGNDSVFIIPKNDCETIEDNLNSTGNSAVTSTMPVNAAISSLRNEDLPVKKPKKKAEAKKKELIVERIEERVMARAGKISEYGETWEVADTRIYRTFDRGF